jgi:transcriptional regulator with XRE-family HTH domain
MEAGALIRQARLRAGLSQAELARRLGTTQSSVARLETPGSNPRVRTLERALAAAGRRLELRDAKARSSIDEGLIRRQLALTPAERLESFERAHADVAQIAGAVGHRRGDAR